MRSKRIDVVIGSMPIYRVGSVIVISHSLLVLGEGMVGGLKAWPLSDVKHNQPFSWRPLRF